VPGRGEARHSSSPSLLLSSLELSDTKVYIQRDSAAEQGGKNLNGFKDFCTENGSSQKNHMNKNKKTNMKKKRKTKKRNKENQHPTRRRVAVGGSHIESGRWRACIDARILRITRE